jgi:hypothetical protein
MSRRAPVSKSLEVAEIAAVVVGVSVAACCWTPTETRTLLML